MDEDNFFRATGTLPIGALGAFQVAGAYNDPNAIWCGMNAWGGKVGVYGESLPQIARTIQETGNHHR